jgi:hypothetical protein
MSNCRWVAALFALVASACGAEEPVVCGDETCAADEVCDTTHSVCVKPAQLDACAGLSDGSACSFNASLGVCHESVCLPQRCGDGRVDPPEECDGADVGGHTCVDLGFYDDGPVTCASQCTLDVSACSRICGDGVIDAEEQCDGSALGGADCTDLGFANAAGLKCNQLCGYDTSSCTN